MRTVSTGIGKDEEKKILEIADVSKLKGQVDIVEDIFAFMKKPDVIDEGDITEDLIKEFVKGKFEYYLPMRSKVRGRIEFFKRLYHHPYYEKFKEIDPLEAATIMLKMLNAFKEAKEQGEQGGEQKEKEKDDATKAFEKLILYGRELFDLLDDPYFQQLMQQQQVGGTGKVPDAEDMPEQVQEMIGRMAKELAIYDLSMKLEFTIRMSKHGKYAESEFPDNGLDVDRIKHIKEVTRALPAQLALDDDIFIKKLVSKELLKKKYMARKEKRQILYVLVDKSGSMSADVNGILTRLDVSKAVCIALMKKLIENEDLFYFRWFDDSCGKLYKVKTKAEALKFMPQLIYGQQSGGGTDIMDAFSTASNEIKANKEEQIDLADILLISDGDASVEVADVNRMMGDPITNKKIDVHTVFINQHIIKPGQDNPYSPLIQASKNFLQTQAKNGSDIVNIVNLFTR